MRHIFMRQFSACEVMSSPGQHYVSAAGSRGEQNRQETEDDFGNDCSLARLKQQQKWNLNVQFGKNLSIKH